jgi:hypothetical protein
MGLAGVLPHWSEASEIGAVDCVVGSYSRARYVGGINIPADTSIY